MTNTLAPFGFKITRNVGSLGDPMNEYSIDPTYASVMAIGDPVTLDANGNVILATAGGPIIGTFQGWNFRTSGLGGGNQGGSSDGRIVPFFKSWTGPTSAPANQGIACIVCDDPGATFEVQTSQTITRADIGAFVDYVPAVADTLFGQSRATVGAPGGAASQFRIERIYERPLRGVDANNNTTGWSLSTAGQYAIVEVKCVKHLRGGAAMAIAV